jgi:mannose-6-phosphate isomerase
MRIYRLDNPARRYDWGSSDGIEKALGIPNPGGGPLAEIWMGAHPSAPSVALLGRERVGLDSLVEREPELALGPRILDRFGSRLPFLLKALSAGRPLSLQAHPAKLKAARGFDRENLSGVPIDAPERNYRDPNHKPEMAVALTPFELLCGFRPTEQIIENVSLIAPRERGRFIARLERNPGRVELSVFFYSIISGERRIKERLLALARPRVERLLESGALPADRVAAFRLIRKLLDDFPRDIGALAPLILNHLSLEPGQAVFIAPGELHAHLSGTCLEIMASSDNVIRGALTGKYVDVAELVSVLTFNPERPPIIIPERVSRRQEDYPAFAPDFQISRLSLEGGGTWRRTTRGPEILLCVEGEAVAAREGESLRLKRGESAFAEDAAGDFELSSEDGAVLYRAAVPDIP